MESLTFTTGGTHLTTEGTLTLPLKGALTLPLRHSRCHCCGTHVTTGGTYLAIVVALTFPLFGLSLLPLKGALTFSTAVTLTLPLLGDSPFFDPYFAPLTKSSATAKSDVYVCWWIYMGIAMT